MDPSKHSNSTASNSCQPSKPVDNKDAKDKKETNEKTSNETKPPAKEESPKNDGKAETKESPAVYELYSILIASGGALGGHYFTFIKSFEKGKWYNFNDSR